MRSVRKKPVRSRSNPRSNGKAWQFDFFSLFSNPKGRYREQEFPVERLYVGAFVALLGIGAYLWWKEYPQLWYAKATNSAISASSKAGFTVKEILVHGRRNAAPQKILEMSQIRENDPIFKLSPSEIQTNLKSIIWVKEAQVQRRLPSTVFISLQERQPIALWQHQQKHYLVDADGVIISHENLSEYKGLPLVVGADAPRHVPKILASIAKHPDLTSKITAMIWVGGRRWNLQLNGSLEVKLPEKGFEESLLRLEKILAKDKLDLKSVKSIDLRQPKQVTMRLVGQGTDVKLDSKETET